MALMSRRAALALFCIALLSFVEPSQGGLLDHLRGFKDKVFGVLGLPGYCFYKCSNGAQPRPKPGHTPRAANGCGSFGIRFPVSHGMTACCNIHDDCYDTCNTGRKKCDDDLAHCLKSYCASPRNDQTGCNMVSSAGNFILKTPLGCSAYKNAQKVACVC